jgi:hypothetical protein
MKIMKTMLAAGIAALAFAALPAFASAVEVDYPGEGTITASTPGPATLRSDSDSITCKVTNEANEELPAVTVRGKFTSKTTGDIEFTFHGCKDELGFNCTSSGQSTGTITTEELTFHIVKLTNGKAGMLVTPNANGVFANFTCAGFIGVEVQGNGVLGEITEPGYNEESSAFSVNFAAVSNTEQAQTKFEGDTESYGLEASIGGGEFEPVAEEASGTGEFTEGKGTITP